MGHTRLGLIPKSRRWTDVVDRVLEELPIGGPISSDVPAISDKTIAAAEGAIQSAVSDPGLRYTFYLLTKVILASRERNWAKKLQDLGLNISAASGIMDLTCELQSRVDDCLGHSQRRTDIGEMAQKAAGETLAALVGAKTPDFFEQGSEQVRLALKDYATSKGFGSLGQKFFGSFMTKFMNFYLSRITAAHLGIKKIGQIGDIVEFNDALRVHCEQSARIVRDFCGQWVSKTEFEEGITEQNVGRFVAVAVTKLKAELKVQKEQK
jgi:hypothetical protein